MDIFESATKQALRFESSAGRLTVEDVWQLPLTTKAKSRLSLDDLARQVYRELKEQDEESFVTVTSNPKKATLQLQLDIIKRVIEVRKEEAEQRKKRNDNAEQKKRVLEALQRKKDQALENMSAEDLENMLNSLNN